MTTAPPPLSEMLDRLIATPSVSSIDPALDCGNAKVNELLSDWLEDLGFAIRLEAVPGHADKTNLIALRGSGTPELVFAGHTDTVPFDEGQWHCDPFLADRRGGRLYGLGSADMKSFFALVIEALRDQPPGRQTAPLAVLATADEESGMAGARQLVAADLALGPRVLIGEPTGLRPVRAHKGIFMLRVVLLGRSGHSSDPRLGRSALEGMHAVLTALVNLRNDLASRYADSRFDPPVPTVNFGRIRGGDNPNRICARCELDIDLRLTPGMSLATARARVESTVRESVADRDLEVQFISLFDGVEPLDTPASCGLLQAAEQLCGCRGDAVSFATEGPFFARLGADAVILGPGDIAVAHQPDEYLELARIEPCVEQLRSLYQSFCLAPA